MTAAISAAALVPANKTQTQDGGSNTALNITGTTVVKANPGLLHTIIIVAATATQTITIIDSTGSTVTSANTIMVIPAATAINTIYVIDWPCLVGISIVYTATATGTLAVSFD